MSQPPSSWYNADGRGYNDVTAVGFNILTIEGGDLHVTGGTSASGPIVAGMLALLNDALLQRHLPPLGFANPLLYTIAQDGNYPGAFNPVTVGDNKCKELSSGGVATCCQYGFLSGPAWDPNNGLGSPQYGVLKEAMIAAANGAYQMGDL